jgi:uncharacterized protein (TIGR02599 family)
MKTSSRFKAGFTLVELMVSTAIIGLIMLVLVGMTNQTSETWRNATEKIEKFQTARDGFESMTRKLSQATLNTNWDYLDAAGNVRDKNVGSSAFNSFVPVYYGRVSDLRFVSGPMSPVGAFLGLSPEKVRPGHGVFFQAPFGVVTDTQNLGIMDNLLNTWGYFVEAGADPKRPAFIDQANVPERWRTRLMEFQQPAEKMSLYDPTDKTYKWFTIGLQDTTSARPVRVLAENVLTLVILPKLSKADEDNRALKQNPVAAMLSPQYIDDSTLTLNPGANGGTDPGAINPKNQLPPILMVTMVAVDERSAQRLADKYCRNAQMNAQNTHGATATGTPSEMVMGMDMVCQKIAINYSTLFTDASKLEDDPNTSSAPGDGDLYQLERALANEGLTYRVFTSNVSIRGSKWSRVQTK